MSVTTNKIRNIAIAGHGGTGKTSLVEQILTLGGVITKPEKVESGKTVSDFTEEEVARGISIYSSLTHIMWKDHKINILDTPGSGDFIGEVISAFRPAELVALLVAADAGAQIETIKIWRRLNKISKPRLIYINKLEKEHSNYEKALADIREKCKNVSIVPIMIPMGSGPSFKGVIDLINKKAYLKGDKETATDIPAEYTDAVEEARMAMIEAAAEGNDKLMEKFLTDESLNAEEIITGLQAGLKNSNICPVLCGAAIENSGIVPFLDLVNMIVPAPQGEVPGTDKEGNEKTQKYSESEPLSLFCFKNRVDQFSGKLSMVKIISGTISSDSEIYNPRVDKKDKLSKIYTCQGKKLEETSSLVAGDIGILAKVATLETNDTLCTQDHVIMYKALALPHPIHSVAIEAVNKKDEDKLNQALHKVTQEDLTFQLKYNQETKETVVSSMGELHLAIILDKIRDNNKIEMETHVPRVAYRETINGSAGAEFTHKKQTGGHGQYAKVALEIKPIERGKHFEFVNAIFGGAVSKGYIPGVEKGIHEAMEEGILAGYPVVDVEAKIVDGKEHPVDSSEMAFKLAARGAFRAAMEKSRPILLEPVNNLEVFVEDQYLGDVLSDLSSKRGRVLGQEPIGGGIQSVKAQVPAAEMVRYAIDLKSITSGTGSFEMEFDHYNPISGKVADDVIKAAQAAREEEK
ncbi:MAG: elongation factor G [Spirochaetales bacterium]|nr:elongation factor G [Spirochaetales bacterium]